MSDPVLVERRGAVAIVTLNVPQKRNALALELFPLLARVLLDLEEDASARALVLHGGRYFCAGGDLDSLDVSSLEMRSSVQIGHRIIRTLIGGRMPTIAAVEGNAFGAGFSLALACDFVVAADSAAFCAAFGRVGLTPDFGLLWTLPQRVGIGKAREILMFCETLTAAQAQALGLVDRMAAAGEALETAVAMAERLAASPPGSISTVKTVLSRAPLSMDATLAWEADIQALLVRSEDFKEGIDAFKQKRKPEFKGR
jgi:enoyl-CoA hydratase/carnithine racemase